MDNTDLHPKLQERIKCSDEPVNQALGHCWLWQGELNRNGYGRVWISGKRLMVHRVTYEILVGPIDNGLILDHLCRNRRCCNPSHLEPVTHRENTLRGDAILFKSQAQEQE